MQSPTDLRVTIPEEPDEVVRAYSDPGLTTKSWRTDDVPELQQQWRYRHSTNPRWKRRRARLERVEMTPTLPDGDETEAEFSDTEMERPRMEVKTIELPPAPTREETNTSPRHAIRDLVRVLCPGPEHRKARRIIMALVTIGIALGTVGAVGGASYLASH